MKRFLGTICFVLSLNAMRAQHPTIYLFPGQGSDKRLFDSLQFDPGYKVRIIEYGIPDKGLTLDAFAQTLIQFIDTTERFVLVGVSLGGMLCVELNERLRPEKTIIISSAKNRSELPFRYRFQKAIPLYKIFPGCALLAGAKLLQPLVEPDRKKNKETFKSMLRAKNGHYMKRTIHLLINWERINNTKPVFHIHGTKDHTLPIRKIRNPTHTVYRGSHMMTLTRGREISQILKTILAR